MTSSIQQSGTYKVSSFGARATRRSCRVLVAPPLFARGIVIGDKTGSSNASTTWDRVLRVTVVSSEVCVALRGGARSCSARNGRRTALCCQGSSCAPATSCSKRNAGSYHKQRSFLQASFLMSTLTKPLSTSGESGIIVSQVLVLALFTVTSR